MSMHNYHNKHRHLPAQAIKDKQGRPLLSWRVTLLPYIDETELYEEFKLDEPWDSPHNLKLLNKSPSIYRTPGSSAKPEMAQYLAPVGRGTVWEKRTRLRDIRDDMSNTILLVEVNDEASVPWTKPEDLNIDFNNPLKGLGNAHPGVFLAVFVDGSVHRIPENIDPGTFKRLLQKDDGKMVPAF